MQTNPSFPVFTILYASFPCPAAPQWASKPQSAYVFFGDDGIVRLLGASSRFHGWDIFCLQQPHPWLPVAASSFIRVRHCPRDFFEICILESALDCGPALLPWTAALHCEPGMQLWPTAFKCGPGVRLLTYLCNTIENQTVCIFWTGTYHVRVAAGRRTAEQQGSAGQGRMGRRQVGPPGHNRPCCHSGHRPYFLERFVCKKNQGFFM